MSGLEAFLDVAPGETRGVIVRNGRFERLLIHRDGEVAQHRLGARSVGRVAAVDAGLRGAFVDLGVDLGAREPFGFLPLKKAERPVVGQKIEVEVTAEPREHKGPALRLIGAGKGEPRLLAAGPSVAETLARLAPGVEVGAGAAAIRAAHEAEEEALAPGGLFAHLGVSLAVERTRALVAVDIDHAAAPGRDGTRDKGRANREGLMQAARLIRLKGWGGLVAVDLVGVSHDGAATTAMARAAFADETDVVIGPVNRFGVLMLSLPWRCTPVEARLLGPDGRPTVETRALAALRQLRLALATDTQAPWLTLHCAPDESARAAAWVETLGPRARLRSDPDVAPGDARIEER